MSNFWRNLLTPFDPKLPSSNLALRGKTLPDGMKTQSLSADAFSLIELLMVIAIIAVLAGVGVAAFGGGGGRGPQGAAIVASSVFNLARTEAILRGTDTLVVIDTTPSSANYLRRMSVVLDGTSNQLIASWTVLPSTACFNQSLSVPAISSTTFSNLPGTYDAYKFKANGQLSGSSAQFVVSQGAVMSGTFQESGTNKRYGFKIHKMGKLTFFNDPSEIKDPSENQ